MNRQIRRRCKCGCGNITNYGKIWINGHNSSMTHLGKVLSKETKRKISIARKGASHSKATKKKMSLTHKGMKYSEEAKKNMSLAKMGNTHTLGHKHTQKAKLNMSLAQIKYAINNNPNYDNYKYCDIWRDKEYRKDIRKDYCENANCKKISIKFVNHHIHLDKKRCAPKDIITLCASCHSWLHNLLQRKKHRQPTACPKDYIIINRPDHISYIYKATRKIIRIEKI